MSERRRRVFPEAFKREAVERAATSGLPIVGVAWELGLNETVLRRWIARYGAEGTATWAAAASALGHGLEPAADRRATAARLPE